MPSKVLVCYTADDYEEAIAVADDATEMSRLLNKTKQTIFYAIRNNSLITHQHQKAKLQWVDLSA